MPNLAEMLMPPKNLTGPVSAGDRLTQHMQSLPQDPNTMQPTGAPNPYLPDTGQYAQQVQNYPQGMVPQGQQDQMSKVKQFVNTYKFIMAQKAPAPMKIQRLAAALSQYGINGPTMAEIWGDQAQFMSPEEGQNYLTPEEYAKAILKDNTGEVFKDALSRIQ